MRRYETIFIIRSNAKEDDIGAIIERTNKIIQNLNGTALTVDKWGLKKLAYLINKESHGFYVYVEYAGSPATVDEIERIFRIDDKIIKYMTIKTQDVYVPGPLRIPVVKDENSDNDSREDDADDSDDSDES